MLLKALMKGYGRLNCHTWLQSPSYPPNDVVDPGYLVVRVDVHTHLPDTDRLRCDPNRGKKGKQRCMKYQ